MKFYVVGSFIHAQDGRGRGGNFGWAAPVIIRNDFSAKEIFKAFPKAEEIRLFSDKEAAQRFLQLSNLPKDYGSYPLFEVEVDADKATPIEDLDGKTHRTERENIRVISAVFDSTKLFEFNYLGQTLPIQSNGCWPCFSSKKASASSVTTPRAVLFHFSADDKMVEEFKPTPSALLRP